MPGLPRGSLREPTPASGPLSFQMCGICGATNDPTGSQTKLMAAAMRHRGPDDEHVYVDPAEGVALGCRRLSVIDVDGGRQPLANEDGSIWATLNGEIYNHPALREGLLATRARTWRRAATQRCSSTFTRSTATLSCTRWKACSHSPSGMRGGVACWWHGIASGRNLSSTPIAEGISPSRRSCPRSPGRCRGPTNSMRQPSMPTSSTDTYPAREPSSPGSPSSLPATCSRGMPPPGRPR